jgi:hypothetical protein
MTLGVMTAAEEGRGSQLHTAGQTHSFDAALPIDLNTMHCLLKDACTGSGNG